MTTREQESFGWPDRARVLSFVALLALVALTVWAASAGPGGESEAEHLSPGTVEAIEGSDLAVVTLTSGGAEKIGLETVRVERADVAGGRLAVPYAALIHGADGTVWVYVSVGDPLRFRRAVVEVAAVTGERAILSRGPKVGTTIAGTGAAELYGTEFEVGH